MLCLVRKNDDPQELVRRALDAKLDIGVLARYMDVVDDVYSKASFTDESKFGLLRCAAKNVRTW